MLTGLAGTIKGLFLQTSLMSGPRKYTTVEDTSQWGLTLRSQKMQSADPGQGHSQETHLDSVSNVADALHSGIKSAELSMTASYKALIHSCLQNKLGLAMLSASCTLLYMKSGYALKHLRMLFRAPTPASLFGLGLISQSGGTITTETSSFMDWSKSQGGERQNFTTLVANYNKAAGYDGTNVNLDVASKTTGAMVKLLFENPRKKDYGLNVGYTIPLDAGNIDFIGRSTANRTFKEGEWNLSRLQGCMTHQMSNMLKKHYEENKSVVLTPLCGAAFQHALVPRLLSSPLRVNYMSLNCSFAGSLPIVATYDRNVVDPDIVAVAMTLGMSTSKDPATQRKTAVKQINTAQVVSGKRVEPNRIKELFRYTRVKSDDSMMDQLLESLKSTPPIVVDLNQPYGREMSITETDIPTPKGLPAKDTSGTIDTGNALVNRMLYSTSPSKFKTDDMIETVAVLKQMVSGLEGPNKKFVQDAIRRYSELAGLL